MSTAVLVPLNDYLGHTPDPDCDYLEGRLVERNVGEIGHADVQSRISAYILYVSRGFWAAVAVRVQVRRERFRVPDVTIVRGGRPPGRIIVSPPEIAVEVLSPEDRAADVQERIVQERIVQERIDDYIQFGISAVWVIDPERQRAWVHTSEGSRPITDGALRNPAGDLEVPLNAVFPDSF